MRPPAAHRTDRGGQADGQTALVGGLPGLPAGQRAPAAGRTQRGRSRIRSSFELSYRSLTARAAQLYQRLGLLETPDFAGWVGAALLDEDVDVAEGLMEQLVDAQLLQTMGFDATGRPRYRFRTLSRLYAREAAHREGDVLEQREALGRRSAPG